MAYDERLSNLALKMGENYYDEKKYKECFAAYLDRFTVVAVTRGDSVIEMEYPFDSLMDFLYDGDLKFAERMFPECKQMIDALESVNYCRVSEWKTAYDEALELYNEMKAAE